MSIILVGGGEHSHSVSSASATITVLKSCQSFNIDRNGDIHRGSARLFHQHNLASFH